MPPENVTEIFFSFYSDILDEETTETLQAEIADQEKHYYKIKSIPFYIPKIAVGDIVWAEYNEAEHKLIYRSIAQHSGNSTIQVIILDSSSDAAAIRSVFEETGCRTRVYNDNYFAVNVLAAIAYPIVKSRLIRLEDEGAISYIESYLSLKHHGELVAK